MTDAVRWGFMSATSDEAAEVHAHAGRIGAVATGQRSLDYSLKLLFDRSADPAERRAVLMRQDLPRNAVLRATEIDEPSIRAFAVGLDRTPIEIVVSAARDESWQVRAEAARRRGCPPEILACLARDPDAIVRRSALKNPTTPVEAVIEVLTHGDSRLDAEVAGANGGFSAPPHVTALMEVNSFGARALMLRGTLPPELVGRFTRSDHSEPVRLQAVRFIQCPADAIARAAVTDESADVRAAAAERPECPAEVLAQAAHDTSPKVRRRVAENPTCPADAVGLLMADPDESVRARAAGHPAAPPSALAAAARGDEVRKVRVAALRHEACPPEVLDELCADPDVVLVAARNRSCTPAGLFQALLTMRDMPRKPPAGTSKDDPLVKRCEQVQTVLKVARKRLAPRTWAWLSSNPLQDINDEDLLRLLSRHLPDAAADPRPQVRIAVAHHPDVDDATLALLASDEDEQVRASISDRILDVALGGTARRR